MVDEVLQGDYDYQDSPFKKGKRVADRGAASSQPAVNRSLDMDTQDRDQQDTWLRNRMAQ